MEKGLLRFFERFTKPELADILEYFDHPVRRSAKKAELVESTAALIGGNPREWMYMLAESDLLLLRDLVSAGPGQWVELINPEYPSILEMLGLIYIDDSEREFVYAALDGSLYFPVAAIIDQLIAEKRSDGSFETERMALGILNIYGVISVEEFVKQAYDMLEDRKDGQEVFMRLAENRLVSLQRVVYEGEMYLVSPYAYEYEKLIDGWKEFPDIKDFAAFTMDEAVHAGSDAPFCAFGYGTSEYMAAHDVLEDLGYDRQDILDCLNEVWVNSQYAMDETCAEALFSCINDRIDDIDSFEEYRRCIDAIADYANSVPKWLLKGHSSTETDFLKLSIKVDESGFDGDFPEPGETEKGPGELPGPVNELYRYSMAVKHVGPDDPCPCGSGLSYRRCHGKNLN